MSERPPKRKITKEEVSHDPRAGLSSEIDTYKRLRKELQEIEKESGDVHTGTISETLDQLLGTKDVKAYDQLERKIKLLRWDITRTKNSPDDLARGIKESLDQAVEAARSKRRDSLRLKFPDSDISYKGEPRYPVPSTVVQGARYEGEPHYQVPALLSVDEAREELPRLVAQFTKEGAVKREDSKEPLLLTNKIIEDEGATQLERENRDTALKTAKLEAQREGEETARNGSRLEEYRAKSEASDGEGIANNGIGISQETTPQERGIISNKGDRPELQSRDALLKAEQELIDEEKNFYTTHGALGRTWQRLRGKDGKRAELENRVDRTAAEYEKSLEEKLARRVADKKMDNTFAGKVAERYRRSVISKDVIDRGEKAREVARKETLAAKEISPVERAFSWLKKRNASLDKGLGKHGARVVRVLTSAGVATAATLLFGPAAIGYLGATFVGKVARGTVGTFGGAAIGAGTGYTYEKTLGKRAAHKLAQARTTSATTFDAMTEKRAAYRAGSAEAIARKRRAFEILGAMIGGAGLSIATTEALNSIPGGAGLPDAHASGVEYKPIAMPRFKNAEELLGIDKQTAQPLTVTPTTNVHELPVAHHALHHAHHHHHAVPLDNLDLREKLETQFLNQWQYDHGGTPDVPSAMPTHEQIEAYINEHLPKGHETTRLHELRSRLGIHKPPVESVPQPVHAQAPSAPEYRVSPPPLERLPVEVEHIQQPNLAGVGGAGALSAPVISGGRIPRPTLSEQPPTPSSTVTQTPRPASQTEGTPAVAAAEHATAGGPRPLDSSAIDASHAHDYLDAKGNRVVFGGSPDERAAKAAEWVAKDHTAVVYYESVKRNILGIPTRHISKVWWAEIDGMKNERGLPGGPLNIGQATSVDDTADRTLRGLKTPTAEDLYTRVDTGP